MDKAESEFRVRLRIEGRNVIMCFEKPEGDNMRVNPILIMIFLLVFCSNGLAYGISGERYKGEIMVPARTFLEGCGFQLSWDENKQLIRVSNGAAAGVLKPGYRYFVYGGHAYSLPYAPYIKNESLMVPMRALAQAIGLTMSWDEDARAFVLASGLAVSVDAEQPEVSQNKAAYFHFNINGIEVETVEISPPFSAELVLGGDYVGGVESLSSMAKRSGAIAAINGSYFDAYSGRPEPYNNLIQNGKVIHTGEQGTTIGFTATGRAQIAPVKFHVDGAINGSYKWPNNWYIYGFNHAPDSSGVYLYTPERGESTGVDQGISVVVENGRVTQKVSGEASIPASGYVINFTGQEEPLADRFQVGRRVDYKISYTDAQGQSWRSILTAVGAGPRLLTRGKVTIDPVSEGFEEQKIISGAPARSAIGIKADGTVILITAPSATLEDLAGIMQQLGAVDALNLDGGASTGLWFNGEIITEPGRQLSNALIFK